MVTSFLSPTVSLCLRQKLTKAGWWQGIWPLPHIRWTRLLWTQVSEVLRKSHFWLALRCRSLFQWSCDSVFSKDFICIWKITCRLESSSSELRWLCYKNYYKLRFYSLKKTLCPVIVPLQMVPLLCRYCFWVNNFNNTKQAGLKVFFFSGKHKRLHLPSQEVQQSESLCRQLLS